MKESGLTCTAPAQGDLLTIGYIVYKLDENTPDTPLDISFFKRHASCARSPSFTNTREMSARHKLAPGKRSISFARKYSNLKSFAMPQGF